MATCRGPFLGHEHGARKLSDATVYCWCIIIMLSRVASVIFRHERANIDILNAVFLYVKYSLTV